MKNSYCFFISLILILGCGKHSDTIPDFSGTYVGEITGTDTFGSPSSANIKPFSDTIQVIVLKDGTDYILRGFDSVDIKVKLYNSNSFSIPSYDNGNNINTGSGSFDNNFLTIQGNWRYTYASEQEADISITYRNYKFRGKK